MEIHNVTFVKPDPVYKDGVYAVFVGYITTRDGQQDLPHYLIINLENEVVEGSRAMLFEARGECAFLNSQVVEQNQMIENGDALFETPKKKDQQSWN